MKKKLALLLLVLASALCVAFAFPACDFGGGSGNNEGPSVEAVPDHYHPLVHYAAVESTCTESGHAEYWYCSYCEECFTDSDGNNFTTLEQLTIQPTGHNFVDGFCSKCNISYFTEGLEYSLSSDSEYYIVTGIGTATDKDLVIPSVYNNLPVTEIGGYAFNGCSSLTSITIPEGVTSIGENAFWGCSRLTGVTFGANSQLESIGSFAFAYCSSLTSITIPEGVTNIDGNAFKGCSSLTSITIPEGVTSIDNYAFYGCTALTEINFNATICNDLSSGNYVFSYAGQDGEGITVNIGANVTKIPAYLFCPDNSISPYSKIVIVNFAQNSVCKSIGTYAFAYCSSLTSITIPESVTSIGYDAFSGCSSLESVIFGANSQLESIGDYAFEWCSRLTSVTIPEGVTSIGENTFLGCSSLTSITIPEGVTSIGSFAFYYCSSLTNITIPEGVTSIGENTFRGCSSLTSITIPEGVTSIGENTFWGCSRLTSITIPEGVTSIGEDAFRGCRGLTIYCEASSKPSGWGSSWNNSGCSVVWDCNNNEVADDGYIYVIVNDLRYSLKDGNAMVVGQPSNISGEVVIASTVEYKGIIYTVTSIGDAAFAYCRSLTSVTFGANSQLESIGERAFSGCDNLTSITIPESVTNIGWYAFSGCSSLTSITIPEGVTSIGLSAFSGCSSLTRITIPDSVTSIGENVFGWCSSLTSITIPEGVTSIGLRAFLGCSSLTIYCEAASKPTGWVSNWNNSNCPVVWDCNNNEVADDGYIYVIVNDLRYSLKDGNAMVVGQPSNISGEVVIASTVEYKGIIYTVTSIGYDAFSGCSSLTNVFVKENNNKYCDINGILFSKDKATLICYPAGKPATQYSIPDGVTSIGERAFSGCDNLTSITIPESVTSIGYDAFSGCSSLESVIFGANSQLESIGSSAFYYCSSLTSVTIPESVTSIGYFAFYGCSNLESVYYAGTAEVWETIEIGSYNSPLTSATRYYYSETQPTGEGNWWHYVDGVVTVW